MESPPPYYSSAPKKSNTGLIIGLVVGGVVLCCVLPLGLLAGVGAWILPKAKGFVGCSITFVNVQRAVQDYAEAHDGTLPKAATWETDIRPFYKKEVDKHRDEQRMFTSGSAEGTLGCTNDDATITGIAFNKEMSGKKLSDIKDPIDSVLLFEVPAAGSNLNSEYKPQPFESSPRMVNAPRGWYVAYVSGRTLLIGRNGMKSGTSFNVETGSNSGSSGN